MYSYRFDPDVIHEQKPPETAHHSRLCLIFFDGFHVNYESDWHTAASSLKTMQEIFIFFFPLEEANVHTHTHLFFKKRSLLLPIPLHISKEG